MPSKSWNSELTELYLVGFFVMFIWPFLLDQIVSWDDTCCSICMTRQINLQTLINLALCVICCDSNIATLLCVCVSLYLHFFCVCPCVSVFRFLFSSHHFISCFRTPLCSVLFCLYSPLEKDNYNNNVLLLTWVSLWCSRWSVCVFALHRRLSEEAPGGRRVRWQRLHQKDERWLWASTHRCKQGTFCSHDFNSLPPNS